MQHDSSEVGPLPDGWDTPVHTLALEEAARRLRSDPARGLTATEAAVRLARTGPNALAESHSRSVLDLVAGQFKSLIVGLLLVAAGVAFALGEVVEGVAVLVVILSNATIGFLTEWRAQKALTALRRQAVATARVIRDGAEATVPASGLVPGDVVVITAGDRVPADGRLTEAVRLRIDEAPLTGESVPVEKSIELVPDPDATVAERTDMAFLGTAVTDGRGRMLVTATGPRTEVGRIGQLVAEAADQKTPLERKLDQLGRTLVVVVLALCGVIVLAGWLRGIDLLPMFEVGVSLAVAAVPEGLTAVTTMTLALGVRRMARMRALVRRLPAVETLGATTVVCTDKTGTLTTNEMTVRAYTLGERRLEVTGAGYATTGEFREDGHTFGHGADTHLTTALRIGALCSDAVLDTDGVRGDPTEVALVVAAAKAGLARPDLDRRYPRLAEVPFSSETMRMVTVHRTPDGTTVAYVKGAPSVLRKAAEAELTADGVRPLTDEGRQRWLERNDELAAGALRVLALGYKELPDRWTEDDLKRGFVLVGLVGMIDPLRPEAAGAVAACRAAGVRTVMITGDQSATAAEIGRQLGLDRGPDGRFLRTVHGRELAGLDAEGWKRVAAEAGVFARVSPEHKLRIVEALQAQGEVVAMTGDGVNDAPALKKADIGVAMGVKGTEVAKEAADMVVTDDNFATLVAAVEQGRAIYANILRFVHYLFSCNLSEVLVVFVAILVGWPLPLAPLQVLWLNLITDVFPALALALESSSPGAMKRAPRDPREPLLNRAFIGLIVRQGVLLAVVTLIAFRVALGWYGSDGEGLRHAVTVAFMTLALAQVFHALSARSQQRSAFDGRLFTNGWLWAALAGCVLLQLAAVYLPPLQDVLQTTPLTVPDWALVVGSALVPVGAIELAKIIRRDGAGR